MQLVALKKSSTTVVDALSINHETDVVEPIALYVRDDEKFPVWCCFCLAAQGSKQSVPTMPVECAASAA